MNDQMIPQDDKLWIRARIGSLTASRMREARSFLKKGGEAQERANYKRELVAERLSGMAIEHYVSKPMLDGIEREPAAAEEYEVLSGNIVVPMGYVTHPSIEWFGATPDRGVEPDGLVEIKCPTLTTFVQWMLDGEIPEDHRDQMIAQCACTGRKWVDFVGYHPHMPEAWRLFVVRFTPTREEIAECEQDAAKFLYEVAALYQRITGVTA